MPAACSRRSFAESLALAALAPTLGLRPETVATPYVPSVAEVAAPAAPGALARALGRAVRAQYGARLSEAEITTITGQIQSSLDRAAQIRKVDLANGDEPDFVFVALPRSAQSR